MDYNWKDLAHQNYLHAYLISPTNLDTIEGELEGVDWSTLQISAAYYSDTRVSGSLTIVGDGWNHDEYHTPRIRIVYEIPDWNYGREVGTFIVVDDPETISNGIRKTQLQLQSLLYAMSLEFPMYRKALAPGAMVSTAMKSELADAGFQYDLDEINDYQMNSIAILETGVSRLSRMFTLTEISNNRIDVDGHGVVQIDRYILPDNKTAGTTLSLDDPLGIIKDGITRSSNYLQQPSQVVVNYKWSDQENGESVEHEISADARVSSGHATYASRGYTITDFHQLNEMSPATVERATQIAQEKLRTAEKQKTEWVINTTYFPIWEGDVINLNVNVGDEQYQGTRKCLVKNVDITGPYMDMTLTLKETSGGDEE